VHDQFTGKNQNFPANPGPVHLAQIRDSLSLTFNAWSGAGLTGMTLHSNGFVNCVAYDSRNPPAGFNGGSSNSAVTAAMPPQNSLFKPAQNSISLSYIPVNFLQIDCRQTAMTDTGPAEAFAGSGTITLTGAATDTSKRVSTGQMTIQVP
jgi:hypothetical protein